MTAREEPRIFGRDDEIAVVDAALRALLVGTPRMLLLVGEAGIGKSTLVAAARARAARLGLSVGTGHCLDVSSHVPCGPVLDALRDLGAPVSAVAPTPTGAVMALTARAAQAPCVLALEDVHWAEASTRDVLRMLAHGQQGPLLVLVTTRDEAVSADAVVRDLVVDLARSPTVTRLDLGPMAPDSLAALAHELEGAGVHPDEVEACIARAAGNPLHLQALLESRGSATSVPPRLADLFLVHLARLSAEAADLVRAASVVGTRLDLGLVAAASCASADRTAALLREARDHRLVVEGDEGLEFRHALVRDALYDDLLPTERRVLHGRVAHELARRVAGAGESADLTLLSPLAHHAGGAGDTATALAASARAGMRWRRDGTDALPHLRRAEELWRVVPEDLHVRDISLTDIREETAKLLWLTGDPDAARRILRDALASAESAEDRVAQGRLHAAYGLVGGAGPEDALWDVSLRRCLELAGPSPSAERAEAHHVNGIAAVFQRGRVAEGRRHLETAHAEAKASGARRTAAATLWFLGITEAESGDAGHGVVTLRRAVRALDEAGDLHQSLLARGDLVWMMAGWTTDPGTLDEARATVRAAREAGMARPLLHALSHLVLVQVWRGELEAAETTLTEMRGLGVPNEEWHWTAADLWVARGRLAEGAAALRTSQEIDPDDRVPDESLAALRAELHLAQDDVPSLCHHLRSYVAAIGDTDSVERLSVTAAYGHLAVRAAVRSAGRGIGRGIGRRIDVDDLEAAADLALRRVLDRGADDWPASRFSSRVLLARACSAARAGEPRPELWEEAVEGLEAGGYRLLALRLRPWFVEDLWAAGRRDEARIVAQQAWDEARAIGAAAVAEQVRRVAVARRMSLPEQRLDAVRAKLTPRECEVLDLLEAGATNRDIARSLVISEKTAGVHVSHLLAKLGAGHRGEAVAMARRAAAGMED